MAWKRLTDLGAISVRLFDVDGARIPEEDFEFLGFTLTVGGDGTVEFEFSNVANAQGIHIVCVPTGNLTGLLGRVNVSSALIEGAVEGGGEPGFMRPVFGPVNESDFVTSPSITPDVLLEGPNQNAVGIDPNPWIYTEGPLPGVQHAFQAGEGMGMYVFPWVGA